MQILVLLSVFYVTAQCVLSFDQPNIVFIMADDLGYADIGYHGGAGQIKTPVLDKLAYEGVRLENYYVQPLCTPSRSALLTGRLPIYTGLQHLVILPAAPYGMPLKFQTLPERLKDVSYSTHMVGKWHLGMYKEEYLPHNRGFDSFYGYYQGAEDYFTHQICASLNQKTYCGLDLHNGTTPDFAKVGNYSTHFFTQEAVRVIKAQAEKKTSPMFMYLAYQNVHQPQEVPPEYEVPYEFIENKQRRILAGQVAVLDEAIGNVTAALKSTGLWNNTILIFSSDNGGMVPAGTGVGCNYPLRGSKGTVWEGGMRVPAFISGPLVERKGTVNKEWMHVSDWFPTILKLAGGSTNNVTLDGFDQWPAISGKGRSPRKELLLNIDPLMPKFGFRKGGSPFDNRQQAALRVGDYKIVTGLTVMSGWYKPVSVEGEVARTVAYEESVQNGLNHAQDGSFLQNIFLFNITADPYERNDLSKEKPEIVEELLARLAEYEESAVPALNPKAQLKEADPSRHGGSWEPWQ